MASPEFDTYGDGATTNVEGNDYQGGLAADMWDQMATEPSSFRQPASIKSSDVLDFSTGDIYGKCPATRSSDPVDRLDDVKKVTDKNFDRIDKNADGFMTDDELTAASQEKCLSEQDRRAIEILKKHSSDIEELSNDETGDENDGISKADIKEFDDLAGKYTEAGGMYRYMKDNMSKVDTNGDGFVNSDELTKRIDSLSENSDERKQLEKMRDNYDELQGQSNDEWGFDNTGITLDDTLRYASSGAAGFDETGLMMDVKSDLMRYWLDDFKKTSH